MKFHREVDGRLSYLFEVSHGAVGRTQRRRERVVEAE